jgi:hypothetical protein
LRGLGGNGDTCGVAFDWFHDGIPFPVGVIFRLCDLARQKPSATTRKT